MRKILTCIIVLAFLCGGIYALVAITQTNIYGNDEEFAEFANTALNERELFRKNENTTVEYTYEKPFSVAVRKDTDSGEAISGLRDEKVKNIQKGYLSKIIKDESEDLAHACIIDTSVKRSGTGALYLVVYDKFYEESDKNMILKDSSIHTYAFSDYDGRKIKPMQAFTVNYKAKASLFAQEYFEKTVDSSELTSNWQGYVIPEDGNFEKYIMTGESVIFYFQPGTVLDESRGVISLKIPQQYMQSVIRPKLLDRYIDPNKPMVAITYDDGPGGKSESRILDCLEKYGCVATFFYQGYRMDKFGYNAVRASEIGCEIGNHSWDHPMLSTLSKKRIGLQLDKTNDEIKEAIGITPELMRPPYGDYNKKVTSVVKSRDMSEVLWTIDTRDWESRNSELIFRSVKNTKKLDGKIILMHSIYNETARATERIVPWLDKHGYQTVTVSELVKYKTGKSLEPGAVYRTLH